MLRYTRSTDCCSEVNALCNTSAVSEGRPEAETSWFDEPQWTLDEEATEDAGEQCTAGWELWWEDEATVADREDDTNDDDADDEEGAYDIELEDEGRLWIPEYDTDEDDGWAAKTVAEAEEEKDGPDANEVEDDGEADEPTIDEEEGLGAFKLSKLMNDALYEGRPEMIEMSGTWRIDADESHPFPVDCALWAKFGWVELGWSESLETNDWTAIRSGKGVNFEPELEATVAT